jgi:hypothetical protein
MAVTVAKEKAMGLGVVDMENAVDMVVTMNLVETVDLEKVTKVSAPIVKSSGIRPLHAEWANSRRMVQTMDMMNASARSVGYKARSKSIASPPTVYRIG